jgi:hypothetical protein
MHTNKYLIALAPDADRYDGNPTTDRIRCPGAGKLQFLITEGVGGTGAAVITAHAHIANSSGTPEAIPFRYKTAQDPGELDDAGGYSLATTSGTTPAAGASKQTLIEFRFDDLPTGKPFVSLTLTEGVNSPVDAGVIAIVKGGDRPNSGVTNL